MFTQLGSNGRGMVISENTQGVQHAMVMIAEDGYIPLLRGGERARKSTIAVLREVNSMAVTLRTRRESCRSISTAKGPDPLTESRCVRSIRFISDASHES